MYNRVATPSGVSSVHVAEDMPVSVSCTGAHRMKPFSALLPDFATFFAHFLLLHFLVLDQTYLSTRRPFVGWTSHLTFDPQSLDISQWSHPRQAFGLLLRF